MHITVVIASAIVVLVAGRLVWGRIFPASRRNIETCVVFSAVSIQQEIIAHKPVGDRCVGGTDRRPERCGFVEKVVRFRASTAPLSTPASWSGPLLATSFSCKETAMASCGWLLMRATTMTRPALNVRSRTIITSTCRLPGAMVRAPARQANDLEPRLSARERATAATGISRTQAATP